MLKSSFCLLRKIECNKKFSKKVKIKALMPSLNVLMFKSNSNHAKNESPTVEDIEFNPDIIYDYDEELQLKRQGLWKDIQKKFIEVPKITYERGKTGVFDVEEVVEYLKEQKALNVIAIHIPPEIKFVDYLVIATGKSRRHSDVLAQYLKKLYKMKKCKKDIASVKIEGEGSSWLAMDLGNIVVHIMDEEVREEKDLETLWTVGQQYDEHCIVEKEETVEELIKKYNINVES